MEDLSHAPWERSASRVLSSRPRVSCLPRASACCSPVGAGFVVEESNVTPSPNVLPVAAPPAGTVFPASPWELKGAGGWVVPFEGPVALEPAYLEWRLVQWNCGWFWGCSILQRGHAPSRQPWQRQHVSRHTSLGGTRSSQSIGGGSCPIPKSLLHMLTPCHGRS